jgi:predicted metal-dependent hydrolase
VRKPRWTFPDDLDDIFAGPDLAEACFRAAFSLTLPHLEPYLIRTYRNLEDRISDRWLAAEVRSFCAQEAQHHRNHAQVNRIIRERLGPTTAAALLTIEHELERDYRTFTAERSVRFNTAYAEAFEAMTCAMGITRLSETPTVERFGPWQQLWAWHLAEEIEHRTVAFDVYHHLGGRYSYRVAAGLRAQLHFLRYLDRLHRVLAAHHGLRRGPAPYVPRMLRAGWRRYLWTFHPHYDPGEIEVPPAVHRLLDHMTA